MTHSHTNFYVDIMETKLNQAIANEAATTLAQSFIYEKQIDTIVCMDGSEIIGIFNFTPVERPDYRIGLPYPGIYHPVFSSDRKRFGGSGGKLPAVRAKKQPMHGLEQSGRFRLPPLSAVFYEPGKEK